MIKLRLPDEPMKTNLLKPIVEYISEHGFVEYNFTIGYPNKDGHYLCKTQFSRFPVVLAYKANSMTWLTESGKVFNSEAVLGFIPITINRLGVNLQ